MLTPADDWGTQLVQLLPAISILVTPWSTPQGLSGQNVRDWTATARGFRTSRHSTKKR